MLFLHGMFGCPRMYTDKLLVQFLQTLKKADWEIIFVQSPRVCQDDPPPVLKTLFPDVQPNELREWVNSIQVQSPEGSSGPKKEYVGLQDSLSFLQSYLADQPRFDVIAGHSNGALMASILSFHMEHCQEGGENNWVLSSDKRCKGILCMNAPNSYETEKTLGHLVSQYGPVNRISSVHVFGGESDHTYEGSQKMKRKHHPNGKTMEHTAGHFFPTEQHYYDDICKALQEIVSD